MRDLISRQAAIDVVMKCYFNDDLFEAYEYELNELPPIQPEIIRCKDCVKRNAMGYCTKFQNNIHGIATSWYQPNDDDFCSRAERRQDE